MGEQDVIDKYRVQLTNLVGDFTLKESTSKVDYSEKLPLGKWSLKKGGDKIAYFELYPMINCCGICVSTRAEVAERWKHKGLGTILNSLRIDIARANGYSVLMCTDDQANEYQRKILVRNGWQDVHSFVNARTKHRVAISLINL